MEPPLVRAPRPRLRASIEVAAGLLALALSVLLFLPDPPRAPLTEAPALAPRLAPPPGPWPVDYTLEARLDEANHRIGGRGTIRFTNTASVPVPSLFFHLYLNAFKNERTLFLRSPFGASRSGSRPEAFGYVDVHKLVARELGNEDLWPARVPHSPNDPEDETDIEVPLPRPLSPGQTLTLEISFEAQLPEIVERTGYSGSFHMVAQWFPKLARLEPDGRWAHFAFHPQAEFYADFGSYDVRLDVPEGYQVGATGIRIGETQKAGRRVLHYRAEPVHDFAWAAGPDLSESRARVGDVELRLLFPPGHENNREATLRTLQHALPWFAAQFGAYPYPTLTVVHPPRGAAAAGGMEYPTLITTGGRLWSYADGLRDLEAVTVHELGHQWFYGLLASNEAQAPYLDEGLNSYAELGAMQARFGSASAARVRGLEVSTESLFRVLSAGRGGEETVAGEAADFSSFESLSALVYCRTATLFVTLGRVFGQKKLDSALGDYARRARFSHPTEQALEDAIERGLGSRLLVDLKTALFARGTVNYRIRNVQTVRDQRPAGFFEQESGRERIEPEADPAAGYRGRAIVHREGLLEFPVDVLLIGSDGSEQRERWDGRGSFHAFEYRGKVALERAIVDPEHRVLIDDDLFDNYASTKRGGIPRVHERLGYLGALLLGGFSP